MSAAAFYFLWILGVFALVGLLRVAVALLTRLTRFLEQLGADAEWPFGPR